MNTTKTNTNDSKRIPMPTFGETFFSLDTSVVFLASWMILGLTWASVIVPVFAFIGWAACSAEADRQNTKMREREIEQMEADARSRD